jgi:hypothetical protein
MLIYFQPYAETAMTGEQYNVQGKPMTKQMTQAIIDWARPWVEKCLADDENELIRMDTCVDQFNTKSYLIELELKYKTDKMTLRNMLSLYKNGLFEWKDKEWFVDGYFMPWTKMGEDISDIFHEERIVKAQLEAVQNKLKAAIEKHRLYEKAIQAGKPHDEAFDETCVLLARKYAAM